METYTATARWDGAWWVVTVDNPPGTGMATTQGHDRTEATDMVTDLLALLLDHRDFIVTVNFQEESKG